MLELTPSEFELTKKLFDFAAGTTLDLSPDFVRLREKIKTAELQPKFYCGWSALDVIEALNDDDRDWPDGIDADYRSSLKIDSIFHESVLEYLQDKFDASLGCCWDDLYYCLDVVLCELPRLQQESSSILIPEVLKDAD